VDSIEHVEGTFIQQVPQDVMVDVTALLTEN
jgi:hypothetical protein